MTFKQLLNANTWPTIIPLFIEAYPDAKKDMVGYKAVFERLKTMSPESIDVSIVITKEGNGDDAYIDVSGLHKYPKNKEETYSQGIEFVSWRKWLGMDISKESLANFSELEIIVHCIYEMTFVGFTEEAIQEKINEIEKSKKERELMTKEESDAVTASVEKILSKWRDEEDSE
ncbi:DUF6557 family protein [Gelidibacter maritimus]|uniref:Uncharacterized protein n=1 Tax=Gelidibacter maritimus TaxID=2761487 RepID=A0A7W2R4T9_9FLAO|nr:DUF6557 family protein [Gelidibacter maritimus]MBA6154212.1 hypothetical protein [Gelidibacter maritimus]